MKEQTPIEHIPSKECERIEKLINHFLSASGIRVELLSMCREGIDDIIKAKVLEALERELIEFHCGCMELGLKKDESVFIKSQWREKVRAVAKEYYETEVKPKYS